MVKPKLPDYYVDAHVFSSLSSHFCLINTNRINYLYNDTLVFGHSVEPPVSLGDLAGCGQRKAFVSSRLLSRDLVC